MLAGFAKSTSAAEMNDLFSRCRDTKGIPFSRLHVPSLREGEAQLYTVVVGRTDDGGWGISRLEGPHRQNATKLTREVGCENLLVVKVEDDAERTLLYRMAASLETDDSDEQSALADLSRLHDLFLNGLEICGRRFSYLAHKGHGPHCPFECSHTCGQRPHPH